MAHFTSAMLFALYMVVVILFPVWGLSFKKKKNWIGGWVGGLSSIQFFLDFWNLFNFAKPLGGCVF